MQKRNIQKIIFKNFWTWCWGKDSLGELFCMSARVCAFVFAVTEPTPGERKAIRFYCLGNKHTKLFSHHPAYITEEGKQVLWVEAMKFKKKKDGGKKNKTNIHQLR